MAAACAMRLRPLSKAMAFSWRPCLSKTHGTRSHGVLRVAVHQTDAPRIASLLPAACRSFASAEPSQQAETNNHEEQQEQVAHVRKPIDKQDEHQEEQKRRRLSEVPISDVLRAKHTLRWVNPIINESATVQEAITTCIEGSLSGMMVVQDLDKKKVVGLVTSRDLLRIMAAGIQNGDFADGIMKTGVRTFMTPISQVIYGRPEETIGMCRTIMAKLGIKCLPILSKGGRVEGLITPRDMSDYGLEAKDRGGKTSFLRNVSERVGLGSNTSMAEPPAYLQAHVAMKQAQSPMYVNVGVAELPHPFKTQDGCGMNHRDFGPQEFPTDPEWSEDAHFLTTVELRDETGFPQEVTYMGVADGVGSWREYGVDPREFSHKLMATCKDILMEASSSNHENDEVNYNNVGRMVTPAETIAKAYERVKAQGIIGSSTACVAFFDSLRHQLHFSNLGDSGIIVLRHIDSDIAGALKRNRVTPRTERKSDMRVAFVSQQQLISFNHPFQLGWTGEEVDESEESSFKSATDSCTTSIHVRRGDIIIMATDGLFDNVDVDDIAQMGLDWEQKFGFIRGGDIVAREKRWAMGNSLSMLSSETINELALQLCERARENSLDGSVDSPFAILAKENDIMWSGGMPDDCTVLAMHVVGRRADDVMDPTNQ